MAIAASSGLELDQPVFLSTKSSSSLNGHATTPPAAEASQMPDPPTMATSTTKPTANGKRADVPDAGLRSHDHSSRALQIASCNPELDLWNTTRPVQTPISHTILTNFPLGTDKRALPKWRYTFRESMLPLVRWETPYLAYAQSLVRTPILDSYFAVTANLGTHTFFMISLPIMFWCGFPWFGKGLVHILAMGVFWTGFIKDMLSLPRPLSPPLHRISMSGSAALEYGFPSTHSTNSVSVAAYVILLLRSPSNPLEGNTRLALEIVAYVYAVSIVLGRLYCGMHGFLDVIVGSIFGTALGVIEYYYGPPMDQYLVESSWVVPLVVALVIIVLVRVHPEPADDCPCFDDSVAFAGVMIGVEFGTWRFSRSTWDYVLPSLLAPNPETDIEPLLSDPFATTSALGWPKMAARVVLGVFVVFLWREVMKPTLLHSLPPLFRLLETHWVGLGMHMPRRFFTTATNYKHIPSKLRMDTVIPNMSDIPEFISFFKHPGRGRSVSVGPQSAADAYETLAYRERRRESVGSNTSLRSKGPMFSLRVEGDKAAASSATGSGSPGTGNVIHQQQHEDTVPDGLGEHHQSPLEMYEQMMGQGRVVVSEEGRISDEPEIYVSRENELGEQEVFSRLTRPRVRYDVEVVTKLVVYAGIAWLSTDIIPVMFEYIGLGWRIGVLVYDFSICPYSLAPNTHPLVLTVEQPAFKSTFIQGFTIILEPGIHGRPKVPLLQ
ncbi:hypothetical protein MKZ38_007547 [Zalerion maritima]|uniref:Phosphatidic acid phosphatase type 2/haloperoxidase domain-containing protein n=1 Tax=Zalerion maritima TaxID=339359 RepID=A0AAD5RM99_9PEZI|nr:hypothetical protein MKZ38_007547 [Zalerion maritima]